MARLLVNKHFTEHNEAINGFTNVEDYAFGEIIICNDSEKPSIYIKDVDNNSVAISNIKVSETDNILSLEDNKLSAKISMVWDSENDKIKLFGKTKNDTDVVLSEIEIFNDEENGIGNKIDKVVERAVDVTLFTATDTELPEGTEIGQDYLKIETSSNGVVKQSYIPFLTVDKLFTIEGEDNTDESGKIIVTKDEENNKYVISHGEVNRVGEKLETPAFGLTPFISEIGVNDLGHVTSVKTSVLPSTPGISITTAPEELPEDDTNRYVSKVTKTDKMELTVTYSELPKVDIDATVEDSTNKTLKFISNIEASGSIITGVTSEVNLDGYAKTGDYYTKEEIDGKFKKIIDPNGELIVPPVVITGDTTEVGKYIYDIDVNSEGALEIKTQALGLDSYVNKDDVSTSDTTLEWGADKEIIKIGEKITTVTLPIKPGIKISEEADTSSTKVIVGVESVETNTDSEVLSMKFKTKEFDFENALAKKDVAVPTTTPTLDWEKAVTIATIGGTKIDVAMPSPVNVEVTGEDVNEINSVVTAIEGDEHGIKVKNAPFAAKNYVAKDEVKTSNVELPWGTKDAEGNVNTTTIATIGEKSINVALPEKPVVGMVTGNTTIENPVVVTNIELNEDNELVVNFQDALPKNYITSEDLKTYLDVDSIKVVDGTDSSTENKFITSIVTGKTEDNDVQLTVNYGKYNIDDDITIPSETVQLEWDTPKEIAKIGNKTISVKLPEKDDVNTIVAEKIVTYDLDKTQEDNKITISLTPTINNEKGEADTIDIDLSDYVNESVDITIDNNQLPENYTGNTFIKNISINGTEITREFGEVNVDVSSNNETVLKWNEAVEIAKVDGKPIYAKLPLEPEKGEGADGNTLYKLSGTLTDDEFKVSLMSGTDGVTYNTPAGSATLNLSGYLTSGDVEAYIPVKDVQVDDVSVLDKDGIAKITGTTVVSDGITLEWGKSNTIAKVNNTEIKFTMPAEPEKGQGADGNTKYTISGSLANDEYKITLNNLDDESESTSATLNLSNYLTSGDVETYIPVKGVKVNDNSVVDADGIANIKIEDTAVIANNPTLEFGETATIAKINKTDIQVTMPEAPVQVETKVDDVQINGTTIVNEKIANIEVVDNDNTLAWNTSVEIAKVGGVPITAKLPVKPDGSNGVTDTTYTLSGATSSDNFKVTLIGSDNSTGIATLNFSDIPFNETSITTGKTNTGNFVKNITFNGNKNHTVNVEYGDPDLSEYSKEGHTHAEYVNQNAFGKVTDGTTTVIADSTIDTLTIAGSGNITVSANASTDTITIGINDGSYSKEGHTHTEYAPVSHKHIASDITGGTLNIARIPTGTDANSVALGNHGHDGVYLKTGDFHDTNATLDGHYDPLASLTATTLSAEDSKYISAISFDKKKHITGITTTALPTSAESAKKLTAGTVGSTTIPVYFKDGEPAVCTLNYLTDSDITQNYLTTKIGNHYLTAETYKGTVTDAKTVVSNTNTGIANAATTNGATYLNTVLTNNGNTNVVSSHNIKGSGSVTVSSDVNGVITISGVEYQPIGNYLTKETYLGTISGITVGSGLTGGGSAATGATDITIKPNLSSYSSLGAIGTTSKLYAVGVDNNNKLCVNVPWADEKYNGTVTSVELKTGSTYVALTGSTITNSGTYTFDLSEATKTKIDNGSLAYGWGNHADKGYWIPETATTVKTGIVKLVTGDMNGKAHADGQAPSLNHTHSQYLTSTDVNNKGYATEDWVKKQGYLDEYDLPIATATALGGIKLGYKELGQNYAVKTMADGTAYVTVPGTDTQCTQDGHYSPETVTETVSVGNQTPSHGGTFNIPTISFDSKGHYVSTGTTTVTLPKDNNTDTKVTSVENHYTPKKSDTKNAEGGSEVDIAGTTTQVITGLDVDAAGHVVSVISKGLKATNTHYTSKNIVSSASTATADTVAIPNGNVYLNHIENGVVTSSHLIKGSNGIIITRPLIEEGINVSISNISAGTGITNTSTGYTQGKAVYEYVNTAVPDIVDDKLSGFTGSDEMVKSEVIDNTTKAYLLASSASTEETGTALKSSSIFMSGNTLTAEAFYQDSDERLKDFHDEIDVDFDKLRDLPKSYFTWKSDDTKTMQLGTSAQKVKELYPELVGGTEESLSVDYARLSIVALKAVDKLHDENEKLRAELDAIKKHLGL